MKKILALVLALMLTLSMVAFAADTAPVVADAKISITNLDVGDTVNLYQVLHWVSGDGWRLTDAFDGDSEASPVIPALDVENVNKLITPVKNQGVISLTKADLEAITNYVKTNNVAPTYTEATNATTYEYTTYTAAAGETPAVDKSGMYLALVEPVNAGIVYNPMVVSSDYADPANTTDTLSALSNMGSSAVAKKEPVTVEKTEPKITNDINDTYNFTINTTVPAYSASFQNTYFKVTDKMSEYLDLVSSSIKLNGEAITDSNITVTPDQDAHGFTINFNDTYIKALTTAQSITITYDAKLNVTATEAAALENVHVENNKVTVEFPNNPKDDTSKTVLKDGTFEYTFTIDGNIFGEDDWFTSELIKVGLDQDGNPIEDVINTYHSQKTHAALNGATFQLYTAKNAAGTDVDTSKPYSNDVWDGSITTANDGRLYMPGLDAGTYYLKELTAPAGYIKDTQVHTIEIIADINGDEAGEEGASITEYWHEDASGNIVWSTDPSTGTAYTYKVPVLNGYTVKFDDVVAASYTMTLTGPTHDLGTTMTQNDAEIVNTKGVELPSTGGIGTTIFYIAGSILVLAAVIFLVTKRRMNANND